MKSLEDKIDPRSIRRIEEFLHIKMISSKNILAIDILAMKIYYYMLKRLENEKFKS
jgi:hypothetical protein